MSTLGVHGLRAERDATLTIAKSLTDAEWNTASDCDGWTVRDVVAHMASILHGVADPSVMPDLSGGTENGMEGPVAERRAWTIEDVLGEYETYSGQVADLGATLQEPPMSETLLPMGHLRNDILKPNGPIERSQPPRDEMRIAPTIEWMLAGLPWMCADKLTFVDKPFTLVLTGVGGGSWTIGPGGQDGRVLVNEGAADSSVATVTSDTHDFVVWGTQRRPWATLTTIDGDVTYAARILDVFKII
jgi:hypothetical protein